MSWKIEFYDETVEANIKKWPEKMMPRFIWLLDLIENIGPDKIDTSSVESLGNGLFKIDTKSHKNTGCALFCVSTKDNTVIILDGFIKSTHKMMHDETVLARNRMYEINFKEI